MPEPSYSKIEAKGYSTEPNQEKAEGQHTIYSQHCKARPSRESERLPTYPRYILSMWVCGYTAPSLILTKGPRVLPRGSEVTGASGPSGDDDDN